jgi:hypothetical protein
MAAEPLSVPLRPDVTIPLGGPYADSPDAYEPEDGALFMGLTLEECDREAAFARANQGRYSPPITRDYTAAAAHAAPEEEVRRAG